MVVFFPDPSKSKEPNFKKYQDQNFVFTLFYQNIPITTFIYTYKLFKQAQTIVVQ